MITLLTGVPVRQTDANGNVTAGAQLYTYAAGTTTPQATYTDGTGATPLSNPVVADATGLFPEIWVSGLGYDLYCKDASVNLLWQTLGLSTGSAGVTISAITVTGTDTIIGTVLPGFSSYSPGQIFSFTAAGPNTTSAVTLNINGLGSIAVNDQYGNPISIGILKSGTICQVQYTTAGTFQLLNFPPQTRYSTSEFVWAIQQPSGTLPVLGGTIGNALSGATVLASSACYALFVAIWNTSQQSDLPVQNSSGATVARGASAASDWAANLRITLPNPPTGATIVTGSGYLGGINVGQVISHGHGVNDPPHTHGGTQNSLSGAGSGGSNPIVAEMSLNSTAPASTGITIQSTGGTYNLAAGINLSLFIAL